MTNSMSTSGIRDDRTGPGTGGADDVASRGGSAGPVWLGSVIGRYRAAKAATAEIVQAGEPDEQARRVLMVAAVVALAESVADVPLLLEALSIARLRAANLAAAGQATLAADADGERDPLFYLRDELGLDTGVGRDGRVMRP